MNKVITVIPGDGIGPEVIKSAIQVLDTVAEKFKHQFTYQYAKLGGIAIDEEGTPLPQSTIDLCKSSDGVLLGAVGGPKWDTLPGHMRPEKGLLGIRKALQLYANLRPVTAHNSLLDASTLKREVVEGVDLMIVRELTGGLYFGQPQERRQEVDGEAVVDTLYYKRSEIERIVKQAFELARLRSKKVTSVDKANVLESSRLWREVAEEVGANYPDVKLEHMLVDNAAMQLIRNPKQFDVVVTENMFGDILSDEASMLTGSLGMLPSASIGGEGPGLYEPIHGSAPDIAGQNKANPLATILSVAMMLRYSFNMSEEADAIEQAVTNVLEAGFRTGDIAEKDDKILNTEEMTEKVIENIQLAVTN
ncbi:3-isopropylmalate dehydrogenase [Anaerobacillus isosaccharinicus]|uniref:3-isopropylmalate dehydrogenase n=1 Tax=Anaerobacillus isosaccharinicus TaxID=1532552 RepID=A0A1S2MF73_9BACI|nr:3-isopropylmalate dehydrogenase [Anaerobacillus isosaccharinicus]MBA5587855.1 3-isopropylmalate dehydrogenase [Anaerobacillus isosaccharinicus]QOY33991.1 3-isopropylmalate dehydrogenase [Anaerobacillus isosaccharinicus]